jgi:DNA-binding NtrC family response regulator
MLNICINVLIIDDESIICKSLGGYLEDYGFSVVCVPSAEEALETIGNNEFDVAIVDLRLPGLSGDAMILQAHEIKPHLCFLIHTGSLEYSPSDELRLVGISEEHVFHKPVADLSTLAASIEKIVERRENENTQ